METLIWICTTGFDKFVVPGVDNNKITLMLLSGFVYGLCKVIPGNWDKAIADAFFKPVLNLFRKAPKK